MLPIYNYLLMDLYKLRKNFYIKFKFSFLIWTRFFKKFSQIVFRSSAVRVYETSAVRCFEMSAVRVSEISAALSAVSVREISTFKSVFSFFKVSISVLYSVDRLFRSFVSLQRPRIERSSYWSSRRSSVLPTRSSVDPTLYSVVEVDLPLRRTNVSQLLLLVLSVAVPGLVVLVGEPLRRRLA